MSFASRPLSHTKPNLSLKTFHISRNYQQHHQIAEIFFIAKHPLSIIPQQHLPQMS